MSGHSFNMAVINCRLKAQGPDSRADAKAIIDTTVMDGLFEW